MLRQHAAFVRFMTGVIDIIIVIFSFFVAYSVRALMFSTPLQHHLEYLKPDYKIAVILITGWIIIFINFGLYKPYRTKTLRYELWNIFKAVSFGTLLVSVSVFFYKLFFVSRAIVLLFWFFCLLFLFTERVAARLLLRYYRRRGYNYRRILIAGTGKRAKHFVRMVEQNKEWGFKIIGFVSSYQSNVGINIVNYPVLGTFDDVYKIISETVVDLLVIAPSVKHLEELGDLIKICEIEGIDTYVLPSFLGLSFAEIKLEDFYGIPMLLFHTTPHDQWKLTLKRSFDIIVSSIALIVCSPLFLLIAILIKLTSKGPVFFTQVRLGLNGRKFKIYKFRTMYEGAEETLTDLLRYNEMDGPVFKMAKDPRVTAIGRILRKTSLDEFPQFYNVWRGEMSVVGPRPPIPGEVKQYERWQRRRLSMKPGITCLWQISGRNNIDFEKWMQLDLEYIDNWSLGLDMKIILKTFPAVLFGVGAR